MSDASGLIVIYPNIHDVEITIYNASGGVISAPSQNTFYMESQYNNRTCATYLYNGNDTAASFTVVKDGYKIYTSDYPASHSGYLPGNIELEPLDNISRLSNGTNTYTIKDSETRNLVSTVQNNLVTSVTSSSTDSQYPSAKCVWNMVGDLENIGKGTLTITGDTSRITSLEINSNSYTSSDFINNSLTISIPLYTVMEYTLIGSGVLPTQQSAMTWNSSVEVIDYQKDTDYKEHGQVRFFEDSTVSVSISIGH